MCKLDLVCTATAAFHKNWRSHRKYPALHIKSYCQSFVSIETRQPELLAGSTASWAFTLTCLPSWVTTTRPRLLCNTA